MMYFKLLFQKAFPTWLALAGLLFCNIQCIHAQDSSKKYHAWWNEGYRFWTKKNPKASLLPHISVYKNRFVNSKNDTLLFRGLSIADPDKIENEGHWNKALFNAVKDMGATLVRIPVHPVAWRERTPEKYLQLLDSAVEWCTDLNIYIIIDWHSIGNLQMELFQDPMYNTTRKETYEFWRTIARHFSGNNTVAFYEIFNEPTTYRGQLGSVSWSEWKKINEDIISLIRAYDNQTIPLVAGFDWAYDLTPLHDDALSADGIAYVAHPYPNKRQPPWEPKWEEDFGFAASRYPVIATEIGFGMQKGSAMAGQNDYGNRITRYLEGRGISWVAWVFDPEWQPALLQSWNHFELSGSGEFFKKALHGMTDK
jgi:hypothetical protein